MKQTALYPKHLQLKARMMEFQGWQVPQVYTDSQEEYYRCPEGGRPFRCLFSRADRGDRG